MIELQKIVDRIEEEFCLKFLKDEDYYFTKRGSSNFINSFSLEYKDNEVEVFVYLTPNTVDNVELRYVIFFNDQIDQFINRLRRIILATI